MNIGSSNMLSLLSSGADLESIQQTLTADSSISPGFSDALMDKLNRLSMAGSGADEMLENAMIELSSEQNKAHGFAGLLNDNGTAVELSRLFGNSLPSDNKLEKDIDLENTLQALSSVMNTLENNGTDEGALGVKVDSVVEKSEAIKAELPAQSEASEKLNEVVDRLNAMMASLGASDKPQQKIELDNQTQRQQIDREVMASGKAKAELKHATNDYRHDNQILPSVVLDKDDTLNDEDSIDSDNLFIQQASPLEKEQKIATELEQANPVQKTDSLEKVREGNEPPLVMNRLDSASVAEKNQLETNREDNDLPKSEGREIPVFLTEQLEKITDTVEQIKTLILEEDSLVDNEHLTEQLDVLITDVAVIKEDVFQQVVDNVSNQHKNIAFQSEVKAEKDSNDLIGRQVSALATSLFETKGMEKAVVMPVVQELTAEFKKENISLKQIADERALGVPSKDGVESLLQQENALRKPGQENPVMAAKQTEKIELANNKEPDQALDKALPKFATDIANLNRAILVDNKQEIAPMTKHFAHPEWNKEMSERVIWMHKQAVPSAELRLNPGHLGPITIKIDVTQDQATVAFTTQHAAVKEAIEAALPKLREMFSAQQLNLTSVDVSQDDTAQKQPRGFAQMGSGAGKEGNKEHNEAESDQSTDKLLDISEEIEAGRAIASNGLLSIFA